MKLSTSVLASLTAALVAILASAAPAHAEADPPFKLPSKAELSKLRSAVILTSRGKIFLELFPEDAPWHVANFKYLADKGFYRGTVFHLIHPGYIAQGGGPKGNPTGGPGYTLPAEFNARHHEFGMVGMARLPDEMNPGRESNGSQFHIVIGDAPHMDGSYTIFGRVVRGADVIGKISPGDAIENITVYVAQPGA